ncbi:MAG: hypothetical protein ACM3SQ_02710 [Betaproteobacteria bacterium]
MTTFGLRTAAGLGAVAVSLVLAGGAAAQTAGGDLSPLQIAAACAPPPEFYAPHPKAVQVAGAQDTVARSVFDNRDLLVLDGGSARGLALGQQYFVRRVAGYPPALGPGVHGVETAGWVRVVAVDEKTAIASVEHACRPIQQHDYLEPFSVPAVPDVSPGPASPDGLDFMAPAHVLFSDADRPVGAIGEFMLIDHGTKDGVATGTRFEIFRDLPAFSLMPVDMAGKLPLSSIADAVVVSVGPQAAVIRIANARDAVHRGDLAVPRK